ncbi:hypothetical protein PR048_017289 [Dryococelus australis]|uniref:DUF4817 domain-containing protein n=1 Tax=Dryococelus australis TaxID=614101 RepID=A0ABQ9H942_9NEOP|nr:hypothetical protein PR048_017289 [Dryococelus australis]
MFAGDVITGNAANRTPALTLSHSHASHSHQSFIPTYIQHVCTRPHIECQQRCALVAVFEAVVMAPHPIYNEEMADIHFIYGRGNGNAWEATRSYHEAFPHRRQQPDSRVSTTKSSLLVGSRRGQRLPQVYCSPSQIFDSSGREEVGIGGGGGTVMPVRSAVTHSPGKKGRGGSRSVTPPHLSVGTTHNQARRWTGAGGSGVVVFRGPVSSLGEQRRRRGVHANSPLRSPHPPPPTTRERNGRVVCRDAAVAECTSMDATCRPRRRFIDPRERAPLRLAPHCSASRGTPIHRGAGRQAGSCARVGFPPLPPYLSRQANTPQLCSRLLHEPAYTLVCCRSSTTCSERHSYTSPTQTISDATKQYANYREGRLGNPICELHDHPAVKVIHYTLTCGFTVRTNILRLRLSDIRRLLNEKLTINTSLALKQADVRYLAPSFHKSPLETANKERAALYLAVTAANERGNEKCMSEEKEMRWMKYLPRAARLEAECTTPHDCVLWFGARPRRLASAAMRATRILKHRSIERARQQLSDKPHLTSDAQKIFANATVLSQFLYITECRDQASFCPFAPREVSVLAKLALGHLSYHLPDVPPQPNPHARQCPWIESRGGICNPGTCHSATRTNDGLKSP